jgi:uncharacterized protein (DUF58 family)
MTAAGAAPEIHYRSALPLHGHFPGQHRSTRGSGGIEFRGHVPLLDAPDARRLDLHASLRDPFGQWRVRVHSQRKAMPVVMVVDLSASMAFAGQHAKLAVVADFTESLAWSAWRSGDSFGFIGCDSGVRSELLLPPTRARGVGVQLAQTLRTLERQGPEAHLGRSADGLLAAADHLGRRRALVFLLSDFHLPLTQLAHLLASLAGHDVVPVVLWDAQEFSIGAARGLVRVLDPESGRHQLLWWRPALRQRWRALHEAQRQALLQVFRLHDRKPLFMEGGFDADAVTRHFQP